MVEITSRTNDNVKRVSKLASNTGERRKQGVIVLETAKLVSDAMSSGASLREIWVTEKALDSGLIDIAQAESSGIKVFLMSEEVCDKLSSQQSSQGVVAVADRPAASGLDSLVHLNRILMLSGVQDPGNVGTAIRSAAAFGFEAAVLSGDCADPFGSKALRASMGSAFKMPVLEGADCLDAARVLADAGFSVMAAALERDAVRAGENGNPDKVCIVIGSEGRGLSKEVIDACTETVFIPISSNVESLNAAAAAAVLMWTYRNSNI